MEVSIVDILETVKHKNALKAQGSDGMQVIF